MDGQDLNKYLAENIDRNQRKEISDCSAPVRNLWREVLWINNVINYSHKTLRDLIKL
jgi:hypothetical protein